MTSRDGGALEGIQMTELSPVAESASSADDVPVAAGRSSEIAGAFAPLIRNAWYAVALLGEIGRHLTGIKVLGEPLVVYRKEDGEAVVLDDRCAHRRFPLSKSHLVGDSIQCGYHGFTYDARGSCTYAPGLTIKPAFGVKRYPCAEKGAFLWVWMGDDNGADPSLIPLPDPPAGSWHSVEGHVINPSNYMLVIENLLDITHLHFLHGPHVQDRDYAETSPKSIDPPVNGVAFVKEVAATTVSLFATWCGGNPAQVVRQVDTVRQFGPSLNFATQERFALAGDTAPVHPQQNRITHCLTPADERSTHQFWQLSYSSPLQVDRAFVRDFVEARVFAEDMAAVGYIQDLIETDRRPVNVEAGIPSDRFGIKMRGILRRLKAAERPT